MFVLIDSPLVGPFTWSLVAAELRRRGVETVVPVLRSDPADARPYWEQHARAVAEALAPHSTGNDLILVGHSGAGVLLPLIPQFIGRPVTAYLFVDAGLPADGRSRLDQIDDLEAAAAFRQAATNGLLPTWSEEDLRDVIPDAIIRQRFAPELAPLPLAVYEEPLPVPAGWPDAPCGYLRFGSNPAYTTAAALAQREGWAYRAIEGEHFHMLVDPPAVADALLELAGPSRQGM